MLKPKPQPIGGLNHGDIIETGDVTVKVQLTGRGQGRRITTVVTSPHPVKVRRKRTQLDNRPSTAED